MNKTSQTKTKISRIDLRVSPSQKALLEKAAALKGQSLSSYLLSNGLETAQADILAAQRLMLSDRDRDLFLELLKNPPPPTQKLTQAMQKFQQEYEVNL